METLERLHALMTAELQKLHGEEDALKQARRNLRRLSDSQKTLDRLSQTLDASGPAGWGARWPRLAGWRLRRRGK